MSVSDYRAIGRLAWPLILSGAIEASFNLTDTWFVGRLSTDAMAALASVAWLDYCGVLLFGGLAMAVQTRAAQAYGAGRSAAASRVLWAGVFACLLAIPAFALLGLLAKPILLYGGIAPAIRRLALLYWWPRFALAGPITVLAMSVSAFYSAIGQTTKTLVIAAAMSVTNALFNELFMFHWRYGIAGSGLATAAAAAVGVAIGGALLFSRDMRRAFRPQLTWRRPQLLRHFSLGVPIGMGLAVDMLAFAAMQLMVVRLGAIPGAAMQIVTVFIAVPYVVGSGISQAGMTLVAQEYGRRRMAAALDVGRATIRLAVAAMAILGLCVAVSMPWLALAFAAASSASSAAVRALCVWLVGPAMLFQACDGWKLASNSCLMGVGDVRVPAVLATTLGWLLWVPAAYLLIFGPGNIGLGGLPAFSLGPVGGWWASVLYSLVMGSVLYGRWRRAAWRRPAPGLSTVLG